MTTAAHPASHTVNPITSPSPGLVLQALLQRESPGANTAKLALDSHAALRNGSHRLAGAIALHVLRPADRHRPMLAMWTFHDWPRSAVRQAREALLATFSQGCGGWRMLSCNVADVVAAPAPQAPTADAELCLRFETPFRFMLPHATQSAPQLTPELLMQMIQRRSQTLFAHPAALPDAAPTLQLLSHFGQLDWCGAPTARGMRPAQFQGSLFLRGASAALRERLIDLQPWHLVDHRDADGVAWHGAYRVQVQREPWLDHALRKRCRMAMAAQRMVRAQDAAPVLAAGGRVLDPVEMADTVLAHWRSGTHQPQPTEAFDLHRPGHAPRRIERLATLDLLGQQHTLQVLTPVFERLFDPHSYGFRPGRNRQDALEGVRAALREGYNYVVESDIAQCFPSIDHERLLARLDQTLLRSDTLLRTLLQQAITQPFVFAGTQHARGHGLAQGSPLSPLLTNLMLTRLDKALDTTRFRYVRYADDFVVLARCRADAAEVLTKIRQVLGDDGLHLAEHKTHITHVQTGFTFLGEAFGTHSLEPLPKADVAQRKPLLVAEPYLQMGVNGDALEVRRQGALVGLWPLRRLSEVLILGPATFSSVLVDRCQRMDVPVAIAQAGRGAVSLLGAGRRRFHDQQIQHAAWHAALSDSARVAMAKEVVDSKLNNQIALITQRRGHDELAETLRELRRQLGGTPEVARLRGFEGQAARLYFSWMREQIVPAQRIHFASRKRARGGPDRLNALMNFAYFLLYARINGFTRVMALNPYLGWLHDSEEDYESLVYDLMEPFRPFVDRIVLRLINRQELRAAHFDDSTGAWRLTRDAIRHVAERFEHGMGEPVQGVPLRELLWAQVRSVRNLAGQQGSLWLFRWNPREPLGGATQPRVLTLDGGFSA